MAAKSQLGVSTVAALALRLFWSFMGLMPFTFLFAFDGATVLALNAADLTHWSQMAQHALLGRARHMLMLQHAELRN